MSASFHAKRETGSVVREVQKGADGIGFLLGVALFTIARRHGGRDRRRDVDFSYDPARRILRDVDFHTYPGKTLAVVGGSGSGKSTLVKLLFRLYQPEHGVIRIDGQDLSEVTQKSLREANGIVPQDTVLFNETIAYKIAYGRQSATRTDVVRAARAAQLDDFIERLPDHYDTRLASAACGCREASGSGSRSRSPF